MFCGSLSMQRQHAKQNRKLLKCIFLCLSVAKIHPAQRIPGNLVSHSLYHAFWLLARFCRVVWQRKCTSDIWNKLDRIVFIVLAQDIRQRWKGGGETKCSMLSSNGKQCATLQKGKMRSNGARLNGEHTISTTYALPCAAHVSLYNTRTRALAAQ